MAAFDSSRRRHGGKEGEAFRCARSRGGRVSDIDTVLPRRYIPSHAAHVFAPAPPRSLGSRGIAGGEEGQHALLHPTFRQAEAEWNGGSGDCGHRFGSMLAEPAFRKVRHVAPKARRRPLGGPASVIDQRATRLRLSPVNRVTVVVPVRRRALHETGYSGGAKRCQCHEPSASVNARTGKLPIPLTRGGAAKNRKPPSGRAPRNGKLS